MTDTDDATFYHLRKDASKVSRWSSSVQIWFRLFWPILTLLGGAFMATVWRPLREIPVMSSEITALVDQHRAFISADSTASVRDTNLEKGQQIAFRILCFNLDAADRGKYGIDCRDIPLPK